MTTCGQSPILDFASEISLSELYAHYATYLWESHRTISYGIELRIVGEMNLTENLTCILKCV